ncbi:hypothetical protein SAMN03097699_2913 [Flavobacteriaceae bacterium MAR_2010_188]|nr:hypothetical protein SAMN03097699_2913 [Flavobacteriaceae bacterium MAR_2010_188]
MKRLSIYLMVIGAIFTSCDPLEDINNDIDSQDNPVVGSVEYTLTDEDYDDLDLSFGSFNSEDQAKELLPAFLADKYPYYGEGSSVNVGYELFRGNAEGVSNFTGADIYTLTNNDYATIGSNANGFYPNVDATAQIPAVLDAQIDGAVEGQIILAKYQQYFENPVIGLASLYETNFPSNFEDFENRDFLGNEGWTAGPDNAQGSGFNSGVFPNEDWLISPEIDLTEGTDLKFQITQRINFLNGQDQLINVLVSIDYTTGGDVMAATWDTFDIDKTESGEFVISEPYDFSAYDGMMIHIAFKYESTATDSPRWRIQSFAIQEIGASGDTNKRGEYFMYNGTTWEAVEDVYYLSSEDFDSMGEESGQPGRFNNFGSSVPPDNYLPQFLAIKYPYAQVDDELFVIYDYFSSSSGAQIRGNVYTYNGMEWEAYNSTISTSLQFGYEDGMWVPDNTIRYTFTGDDYALAASTLLNEPGFEAAAGNLNNFGNFNRTGGSTNWSDDMMLRAISIVLNDIDPSAEEGQKYIVTVDVYIGSSSTQSFKLINEGGEWVYQS